VGALSGETVVDLLAAARAHLVGGVSGQDAAFDAWYGHGMEGFIEAGTVALHNARQVLKAVAGKGGAAGTHPVSSVRVLAPLARPSKIICVGLNYMDHCREQKVEVPASPVLFSKAPTALVGPGDPIRWPRGLTEQADPEIELGVVIGARTKGVAQADALSFVFGYTVLNDVSARDVQFGDKQWVRGKSLDTFCPIGPVLVTRDEIPDPQRLALICTVSGRVWQKSNTAEMIFPVAAIIAFIARGITLLPGDLIATGTPHGVGVFQKPPVFLKAGDTLRLEIEGIGSLDNPVEGPE
jgi:2-keto-4-pentenoate hydratase/2-oxohepta-3-ene-1,7-dioic acid hydratase in catechol pathway